MTDEELFKVLLNCLLQESGQMDPHYFQVPVQNTDKKFLRERVYCYELYYLLRHALGNQPPCKLMGELNKNRHPIIHQLAGPKEPDFVWHEPGEGRNIAVVEVKALCRWPAKGNRKSLINHDRIIADTKKLLKFLHPNIDYRMAIQLVYGHADIDEVKLLAKKVAATAGKFADRILVVWHPDPSSKAQVIEHGAA